MGRGLRVLYPFRGLKAALAGLALVLMVASTQAADYIPAGQPIPQSIRWVNATATGVDTSAFARMGEYGSRFPVPVSSSTLGALTRGALRRGLPVVGWGLALRDIVNGAGWLIDELQDQVTTPGQPPAPLGTSAYCITVSGTTQQRCATAQGSMCHVIFAVMSPAASTCAFGSGNRYRGNNVNNGGYVISEVVVARPAGGWAPGSNGNPQQSPITITDQQLGELLRTNPQVINAILIDPDTGAPIRTPELVNALNNLRRALEAANGLEAGADLVPDPSYGEETTPSQTSGDAWPGFCDWATTVCDFIDWAKAPEEETPPPEDPWAEEPQVPEQEWSSGLGGGSCPGPITFNVSIGGYSQNVEFSYQPACEAATWIRGIAIPLCGLLAVFIVGGYRRSVNA